MTLYCGFYSASGFWQDDEANGEVSPVSLPSLPDRILGRNRRQSWAMVRPPGRPTMAMEMNTGKLRRQAPP